MKTLTEKQIKAEIKVLDKYRGKINARQNSLQKKLDNITHKEEANKLLKSKYLKTQYGSDIQLIYVHSVKVNKKALMNSTIKIVQIFRDSITHIDQTLYYIRGHVPAKQDEFVKAFTNTMKEIDSRLPLIKKTKVGL